MEQMSEYRHIIEEKTKGIFIDSMKKALEKTKLNNIGFIGIAGSYGKKISHDIDVLIFPTENAKIGEAIIEVSDLYDKIENLMKSYQKRFYLALASRKIMQEMTYYISSLEEGGAGMIPVHSLFFPDMKSFKRLNPKNFQKSIENDILVLYGSFDVIKNRKEILQEKLEPYFFIMDFELMSKTKTFPRHLIRTNAESLFSYLRDKYSVPISKEKFHEITDIKKEVEKILRYLDDITYNNR